MDPIDRKTPLSPKNEANVVTLGELISYYYERFAEIYENEELRQLAVWTTVEDLLIRTREDA